jgi:Mycothiol maleylpyruvate isomerase N-terminal domain
MIPRVKQTVEEIVDHRVRFEAFCRSLSAEQLARPVPQSEWIVKDYIAHLATIDLTVTRWFEALAAGEPQPQAAGERQGQRFDIDRWNNAQVERRREWTIDELFAEARETRAALVSVMERFSDEVVDGQIYFPGDAHRQPMLLKLEHYLIGWAKHDPIHVRDMLRALPERHEDAELNAWLASSALPAWPPAASTST